jgi:hypothetical protein
VETGGQESFECPGAGHTVTSTQHFCADPRAHATPSVVLCIVANMKLCRRISIARIRRFDCRCFSPQRVATWVALRAGAVPAMLLRQQPQPKQAQRAWNIHTAIHRRPVERHSHRILGAHSLHKWQQINSLTRCVSIYPFRYFVTARLRSSQPPSHKSPWSEAQHPAAPATDAHLHTTTRMACRRRCKEGQQCAC